MRTRIARTTDPIVVELRRSRKPRVTDASCQTEVIPEYGTLADYLNPPPPEPEPKEVKIEILCPFQMCTHKKPSYLLGP